MTSEALSRSLVLCTRCNSFYVQAISDAAYGIQLAAKIVDTPCSEMHTDGFLEARNNS